jgi:hypothetical protein
LIGGSRHARAPAGIGAGELAICNCATAATPMVIGVAKAWPPFGARLGLAAGPGQPPAATRRPVRAHICSSDRNGLRHCCTCRTASCVPYHLSDDRRPRAARPGGAVVSGGCVSGAGGRGCSEGCPWWCRCGARPGSGIESAGRPGMLSASQSSASGSEPQSSLGGSSRDAAAWVHNPRCWSFAAGGPLGANGWWATGCATALDGVGVCRRHP